MKGKKKRQSGDRRSRRQSKNDSSRREFIQKLSLAGFGLFTMGTALGNGIIAVSKEEYEQSTGIKTSTGLDDQKTMIFIVESGGNDTARTIFYDHNYDNLKDIHSQNLMPDQADLLPLDGVACSLHPKMTGMQTLFNQKKAAIINGVGVENQSSSHFAAKTQLQRLNANISGPDAKTGFLGRHLEPDHPYYPTGYPNVDWPEAFAITWGGNEPSMTCDGYGKNYSKLVNDPTETSSFNGDVPDGGDYHQNKVEHIADIAALENGYNQTISSAYAAGFSTSPLFGNYQLAQQLKDVAKLLSGGLSPFAIIINHNGYDTHDGQVESGNPNEGRHPKLLEQMSDAVYAFQMELETLGIDQNVITIISSEFGRRIKENGSRGTDHGRGGHMFVVGSCIDNNNQIVGPAPVIEATLSGGSLPITVDRVDVIAGIMINFFGDTFARVAATFPGTVIAPINLINCSGVGLEEESIDGEVSLLLYPNPATEYVSLKPSISQGKLKIDIRDSMGRFATSQKKIIHKDGVSELIIGIQSLAPGSYLLILTDEKGKKQTGRFIKQ